MPFTEQMCAVCQLCVLPVHDFSNLGLDLKGKHT